jgi:hypothetical protein
MKIEEGPLSPIPATKRFLKFHGNYCGPGNRGGNPVDDLDAECKKHDTGYHYTRNDPAAKTKRLKHDAHLVKAASSIASDKSKDLKQRIKAKMVSSYFKTKIKANSLL